MAASEKERIFKLESRAKEAENALQQLRAYVELLKKKASKLILFRIIDIGFSFLSKTESLL